MRIIVPIAVVLLLCASSSARAEPDATTFIHSAAEAPSPILLDARLVGGFDWEMTSLQTGGFGLRAGVYGSPLPRTRLQLWASETGGGSLCADGSASAPPNPFLGCYATASTALGFAARQGILKSGPVELGIEAGVSARTVPATILIIGLGERLTLETSVSFSAVALFARAGAGLSEIPAASEVDRVAIVGAGIEGAIGRVRPCFELSVNRVDRPGRTDARTGLLLSFGLGFEI